MTIRTILVCLSAAGFGLFAATACEIHNCDKGATCNDWSDPDDSRSAECNTYCGRLSVCGAGQARDFDACVNSCKTRYERLPDETHRLCTCAETSSCGDVIEGRCSSPGGTGGSCNSCGNGGAPASGGAPSGNGGAPTGTGATSSSYGGAPGGAPNASGGAPVTTGGASSNGGEPSGATCHAACDCPATENCVEGHCVPL